MAPQILRQVLYTMAEEHPEGRRTENRSKEKEPKLQAAELEEDEMVLSLTLDDGLMMPFVTLGALPDAQSSNIRQGRVAAGRGLRLAVRD